MDYLEALAVATCDALAVLALGGFNPEDDGSRF